MRLLMLGGLVSFLILISACEKKTKIEDGLVPAEFIPYVQKLLGSYKGTFESVSANWNLSLEGQKAVLTPYPDVVDPRCESKVGNLLAVYTKKNKDETFRITEADFAFDAGSCAQQVRGTTLRIYFSNYMEKPLKFDAELFKYTEIIETWECDPDWGGNPTDPNHCRIRYTTKDHYLTGKFAPG